MELNSLYIGKAGELRIRSELLFRGMSCATFDQDTGADMVLFNGKKLQIKTSLQAKKDKNSFSWRYSFAIRARGFRRDKINGNYKQIYTKKNYDGIDFIVLYGVKDNLFYIIPEKEVGERVSIVIATPDSQRSYKKHTHKNSLSKYEKYKDAWDLLL